MSSRINVKPMPEPSRQQARSISHPGAAQVSAPTQIGAEVGRGLPPEGSSEMASAAVAPIAAGIAGTMSIIFPEASGRNIAALMGFAFLSFITSQSW